MTKPPSPRPLSIKVISGYFLLLCILEIPLDIGDLYTASPLVFDIHGLAALTINAFEVIILLYLGFSIWYLSNAARLIAICYSVYMALDSLIFFSKTYIRIPFMDPSPSSTLAGFVVLLITAFYLIMSVACIWFLIKRKSAFVKPAPQQEPAR